MRRLIFCNTLVIIVPSSLKAGSDDAWDPSSEQTSEYFYGP